MGRNNDGEVHAAAVSDDTVDGPQAPPYCRFFTIAFVLTLVLVVFPIIVQLVWMFFKSERVTYHPWIYPCSENFPVSIIAGMIGNWTFLGVGVALFCRPHLHQSPFIIRSFQFLTSKRFKLGRVTAESTRGRWMLVSFMVLALGLFPFFCILAGSEHGNALQFSFL